MKRFMWLAVLGCLSFGGCVFDADRRREVWQREKAAADDLSYLFDHLFIEPR